MDTKELDDLRIEINEIDDKLIKLFEKRMNVVRHVAEFKIKNGMKVLDKSREDFIINKYVGNIRDVDTKNQVTEFLQAVLKISRDAQSEIIKKAGI